MRTLGNKVAAREAAIAAGVPVIPATGTLPADHPCPSAAVWL
jgi:pyruvate carboxylase